MAVVFNGITRQIEVTDSAIFELAAGRELYSEWKRWQQLSPANAGYAPAFRTFGGDPTATGQFAPKYYFLINLWTILINNGNIVSVSLNLYSDDFTTPYIVIAGSGVSDRNSDAVSVNSTAIEYASFGGGITIDENNITGRAKPGTGYPTGTIVTPSSNVTDLLIIAADRGFDTAFVKGNLTLNNGNDFSRFIFIGESPTKSTINVDTSANVINCEFSSATVTGVLDGNSELVDCIVNALDFVDGRLFRCDLGPDPIKLGLSTIASIYSCYSTIPGVNTPIIDMNGTGILSLRDYYGGIELRNYNGFAGHSIDLSSGQVKLDPNTILSGTFVCRGIGKLVDASTGDYIKTGIWNGGVTIVNELINLDTIGEAAAYTGAVFIDSINGTPGTDDPVGLERDPVNNLADAVILATRRGTSKLFFKENYNFLATDFIVGFTLMGKGMQFTTLTFNLGCVVAFCDTMNLTLTGVFTGVTGITECTIDNLGSSSLVASSQDLIVRNCKFKGVTSLSSNYSGNITLLNPYSDTSVLDYPVFDAGDYTGNMTVNNFSGRGQFKNITQGNLLDLRIAQGDVILDDLTVTNCTVRVVGIGRLLDNSGNEILTGVWNGGVQVYNNTITDTGGGGSSPWSVNEKDFVLAYSKKASDNAEQANLKL